MNARYALACGAILLSLAAPGSAHAQFGGLMKKAKDAAADAAGRKAGETAVDKAVGSRTGSASARSAGALPGEPLTEATFAALLRGLQRTDALLKEAEASNARMSAINGELQKLYDAHPGEIERFQERERTVNMCHSEQINTRERARSDAMQKKMEAAQRDPAAVQRMSAVAMKYTPRINEAQQRGDVATMERLMNEMQMELTGTDMRGVAAADTAAAVSKCGPKPVAPKWMAEARRLQEAANAAGSEQRAKESRAVSAGAEASGMSEVQYGVMRERLELLLRKFKDTPSPNAEEQALLDRHRSQLSGLTRAIGA
jgi:hypothetical protein